MILVDGGYLAWCYGSSPAMMNGWSGGGRRRFAISSGAVIVMDSRGPSWREHVFPEYKARRRTKLAIPERLEKKLRVDRFKEDYIRHDPSLMVVEVPGMEADDVISILVTHFYDQLQIQGVIGIDKDYLQLKTEVPFLGLDLNSRKMVNYSKRLQKTVQHKVQSREDVIWVLTLLGDHSDGIPPILKHAAGLRYFNYLMGLDFFNRNLVLRDGEYFQEFVRNLYLTLLPGPICYDPLPSMAETFVSFWNGLWPFHGGINSQITKVVTDILDHRPSRWLEDNDF